MDRIGGRREPVMCEVPRAGHVDEPRGAERGQVARDRRLRQAEKLDDVADAQLAGGEQAENAEPGGVGERLEEGVEVGDGPAGRGGGGYHMRYSEYDDPR